MKNKTKERVAYIIPGNLESSTTKPGYKKIAKFFETNNIEPKHIKINWKGNKVKSFDEYNKDFIDLYQKQKNTEIYILGFSFGALIAFLTASKTKPKAIILCSLSPYFSEDLLTIRKKWADFWHERFPNDKFNFKQKVKGIKCKTYILVGGDEGQECIYRAQEVNKNVKGSELYIVEKGKHNINQKVYLKTIDKVIKGL
jgi:pimeloyl-ACP methyl ester carboxylesterase